MKMPASQETDLGEINTKNILVIHPGSLYVRIGRASDSNPCTVLHAIARKRLPNGLKRVDNILPPVNSLGKDEMKEVEDARLLVSHLLQSQTQSSGRKRYVTPPQQIAAFNRRVTGQTISSSGGEWHNFDEDVIVGDDVLNLDPELEFNVHFPIRRGELNIHSGVSGSLMAVLADLQAIWSYVICYHLGIEIETLSNYRAVLVISDIFSRQYTKEFVSLLLRDMNFGSCFLVQDHVAATFGVGMNYACVVDIGHEKTSISCVEDGMSESNTRVRLGYGGADITQTFHWLLKKCAFPYTKCDPSTNKLDAFLMQKLKHDFCHVHLDICGSYEKTFVLRQPKIPAQRYTIQVGDECIIAVLAIFYPESLGMTGSKTVITQTQSTFQSEDFYDEEYFRETSRRATKEIDGTGNDASAEGSGTNTSQSAEEEIAVDNIIDGTAQTSSTSDFVGENGQPVGLDQAIVRSIDKLCSDEAKRKFYNSILVVGGGIKFPGMPEFLEKRLSSLISSPHHTEHVELYTSPKEMDPENVSWKGAAVMATLESAQEVWIHPDEWRKIGARLLRERSVFMCFSVIKSSSENIYNSRLNNNTKI